MFKLKTSAAVLSLLSITYCNRILLASYELQGEEILQYKWNKYRVCGMFCGRMVGGVCGE